MTEQPDPAVVGRVGLEGEAWITPYIGVGGLLTFQEFKTFSFSGRKTGSGQAISLAPAVTLRTSRPMIFPVLSVAFGMTRVHDTESSYCEEPGGEYCELPGHWDQAYDIWGFIGSVSAAWLFHVGDGPPSSAAFEIGPTLHVDFLNRQPTYNGQYAYTFTTGMTIGFGVTQPAPR